MSTYHEYYFQLTLLEKVTPENVRLDHSRSPSALQVQILDIP
jgi:hypothetical protein